MTASWLLALLATQPAAAPATPAAPRCLPAQDGFITMRLRGSIEQDVHWTEPALECTGMPRPDGKGLRVRFAGALAGGPLAVVFAAPGLGVGRSGKRVPVNLTLLDGAGERIYGTQGDSRCEFDEVEQQPIEGGALPANSFRIRARGFCVAPARALDGEGSVLVTRFDFVGRVTSGDVTPEPDASAGR
jgi:hypothetical protein